MSQATPDDHNVTPPTNRPADPADARLSKLHKMSTTAGVTNTDYVAVNHTAIAAVLLGLASGLAFFGYLLLVIPVVGIVFAIVAVRQISDSNGTQTGKGLAILGLVLCVLFGGGVFALQARESMVVRDDERKIAAVVDKMSALVREGRVDEAYKLMDDSFRDRISPAEFTRTWNGVQRAIGKLQVLEWNGVRPAFEDKLAAIKARARFEKADEERFDIVLIRSGAEWKIFGIPSLFAEPKKNTRKSDDVFSID